MLEEEYTFLDRKHASVPQAFISKIPRKLGHLSGVRTKQCSDPVPYVRPLTRLGRPRGFGCLTLRKFGQFPGAAQAVEISWVGDYVDFRSSTIEPGTNWSEVSTIHLLLMWHHVPQNKMRSTQVKKF